MNKILEAKYERERESKRDSPSFRIFSFST